MKLQWGCAKLTFSGLYAKLNCGEAVFQTNPQWGCMPNCSEAVCQAKLCSDAVCQTKLQWSCMPNWHAERRHAKLSCSEAVCQTKLQWGHMLIYPEVRDAKHGARKTWSTERNTCNVEHDKKTWAAECETQWKQNTDHVWNTERG